MALRMAESRRPLVRCTACFPLLWAVSMPVGPSGPHPHPRVRSAKRATCTFASPACSGTMCSSPPRSLGSLSPPRIPYGGGLYLACIAIPHACVLQLGGPS
eukprot:scaffold19442_cov112-Isochrysis_galbana.AAC.2